jgi:hypothetical protein
VVERRRGRQKHDSGSGYKLNLYIYRYTSIHTFYIESVADVVATLYGGRSKAEPRIDRILDRTLDDCMESIRVRRYGPTLFLAITPMGYG